MQSKWLNRTSIDLSVQTQFLTPMNISGWDKQACIWDTQTGELLQQLSGHDEELTHASAHPTSRLVVTSSKVHTVINR